MAKPTDPLTEQEKAVFGADARRHPVIGDLILEQSSGMAGTEDMQAWAFVENLAKTDPEAAAAWRLKVKIAKGSK
jgi:hypothetical protein